jgi:hypothetical protein
MRRASLTLALMLAATTLFAAMAKTPERPDRVVHVTRPTLCKGKYALCISAPCTPIPTYDKKHQIEVKSALCECDVVDGPSLGDLSCAEREPQGANGQYIVSTYSFEQLPTKPLMSCPSGTPWTFCYDQPCEIDAKAPTKATCTCPMRTSGAYVTEGGSCDTAQCAAVIWSGATPKVAAEANKKLAELMGLPKVPENNCPAPAASGSQP